MRIRSGTKALKGGKVLVKSAGRGPGKIMCTRCRGQAVASIGPGGKTVYKCSCGTVFKATVM